MKKKKQPVRQEHPRPYGSPLWPHLDLIRSERQARKTWEEIAQKLHTEHGITTNFRTVHAFFKRVSQRARKGQEELPLGFVEPPRSVPPPPTKPATPPPPKPLDYVEREDPYNQI